MKIKKSLGQNFFINQNLGERIVSYVSYENAEVIVEIGPGRGFFTKKLAPLSSNIITIEKDDDLAQALETDFPQIEVLNKDFLDWDFKELEKFKDKKICFFGSLPYNVSKPIIHKIISSNYFNNNCYFIVQKEVAEKYTSREPQNNILSLKTQLYAIPKKLIDINPGSFMPRPKVISSVIMFTPSKEKLSVNNDKFTSFVEQCFRSPRKTLRNNLKSLNLDSKFDDLLDKRPENLSLGEYLKIFTNLH